MKEMNGESVPKDGESVPKLAKELEGLVEEKLDRITADYLEGRIDLDTHVARMDIAMHEGMKTLEERHGREAVVKTFGGSADDYRNWLRNMTCEHEKNKKKGKDNG